ncbi:MAG TPA: hypothetical protein PK034_09025 [Rugosibacter sp.]|mgnify:CR=1 FL=1|nr:hypothetical protein [Rugosibacter sp.]
MALTSSYSSHGIIATHGSTVLGQVTNIALTEGAVDLDDTDLSHARENHQTGIATVSGSIDCLGDPKLAVGDIGALVLSGTLTKGYGSTIVLEIAVGAPVKGQVTTRYTFASEAEGT